MRYLLVLIAAACGGSASREPPAPDPTPARAPAPARGSIVADSVIARADYLGPAACAECHLDQHAAWQHSLHATMNQRASSKTILGAPTTLAYAGGTMTFDGRVMTVAKGDRRVAYRVTRTIGTRGLQEYVGIAERGTEEVRLPFAWWPRRAGWYPQPYFDPWLDEAAFDAYAEVTEPWATRCPWCHSTYPFAQRIARSAKGVGHGLEQFFELPDPAGAERLRVDEQVTVGISCESCHLGGRAHAAGAKISLVPVGATARPGAPRPRAFAVERADPAIVNRVCAQCHSGPSPQFPDGSSSRNSREALDLASSACTARCIDCHDPHRADARLDEPRAVAACTKCHPARVTADHAGAGHAQVTCLDCHMPRTVMGIDRHVRTHRIGSPSDRRMLAAAAPNACSLCHLDRTIRWTTDELRAQYGVRLDPSRWPYRESVGETWLASREPAVRLIAAAAYARSPLGRGMLPELAAMLDDPLAYVRVWVQFAIEDILGRRLTDAEYDPRAPPAYRRQQRARIPRLIPRMP